MTLAIAAVPPDGSAASLWAGIADAVAAVGADQDPQASSTHAHATIAHGWAAALGAIESEVAAGFSRVLVVDLSVRGAPGGPEPEDIRDALDAFVAAHSEASIRLLARAGAAGRLLELVDLVAEAGSTPRELVAGAMARAFGPEPGLVVRFLAALHAAFPPGTAFALRGSAVLGYGFKTGRPFDGDGPGTSDLDIVAIGEGAQALWHPDARILGGLNTLPLSDASDWIAPSVDPARRACQAMVSRPVSIQVMARWFLDLRAAVQGQPYVDLLPG